jgi:hypothetical protein
MGRQRHSTAFENVSGAFHATNHRSCALRMRTGDRIMDATILFATFISVFAASGVLTAYWYAK